MISTLLLFAIHSEPHTNKCPDGYLSEEGFDGNPFCYPRDFQPSKEYQIVRNNQVLPKGLHIQIDMTTGQKLAKIDEANSKKSEIIMLDNNRTDDRRDHLNLQIKHSKGTKFDKLITNYLKKKDDKDKGFKLINEIEEKAHDLDYGILFCKRFIKDELIKLIDPNNIQETINNNENKQKFIEAIGSSLQNSQTSQGILINEGTVEKLIEIIKVENNDKIINKDLYFLSGLVRGNYEGIERFHNKKGSSVLLELFNKYTNNDHVLHKIVNLIGDTHDPNMVDSTKFQLETQSILETNEVFKWCNRLTASPELFSSSSTKTSQSMKTALLQCLKTLYTNFDHYCTLDNVFINWAENERRRTELNKQDDQTNEYRDLLDYFSTQ